jgi:uncharacterized protein (UPF0276 family)
MYLAINYSPPAAQLVQSGQIDIDFFKTPNWEWMIDEAKNLRPVAIHYNLEAGNGRLDKVDWNEAEQLAQATGTPYFNLHLDPKQKHHPRLSVDTNTKSEIKQVFKIILSDVMVLVDRFGPEKVIVENSPYRGEPGNTLRLSVEPDLITRVIKETGCGLLLDISHAIITSHYLGMDPYEYFSRLPTQKVMELHFAGTHKIKRQWIDHQSIRKRDWHWLDWVFSRIQSREWSTPWLLAFEYGGVGREFEWRSDPEVIGTDVPLLCERVKKLNLHLHLSDPG